MVIEVERLGKRAAHRLRHGTTDSNAMYSDQRFIRDASPVDTVLIDNPVLALYRHYEFDN